LSARFSKTPRLFGKIARQTKIMKIQTTVPSFTHITGGSKGNSLCHGTPNAAYVGTPQAMTWPNCKGTPFSAADLNNFHKAGKPMPPAFEAWNQARFVGKRGEHTICVPIKGCEAFGFVKGTIKVKFGNGEVKTLVAYRYGTADHYFGVPSLPAGRIETFGKISDGRNVGLTCSLVSADFGKPVSKAKAPAAVKTPAAAKPASKATPKAKK
jgi:hypothetical protein